VFTEMELNDFTLNSLSRAFTSALSTNLTSLVPGEEQRGKKASQITELEVEV
jgi:hypothetical protein